MSDFDWSFEHTSGFESIPVGDYRMRVKNAEKKTSAAGNDMLVLELEVSGFKKVIRHYIVFLPDKREITNRNLTNFYESFGISEGNLSLASFIGACGAGHVKIDEKGYEKVSYFISGDNKDFLPAWEGGSAQVDIDEIPFD